MASAYRRAVLRGFRTVQLVERSLLSDCCTVGSAKANHAYSMLKRGAVWQAPAPEQRYQFVCPICHVTEFDVQPGRSATLHDVSDISIIWVRSLLKTITRVVHIV